MVALPLEVRTLHLGNLGKFLYVRTDDIMAFSGIQGNFYFEVSKWGYMEAIKEINYQMTGQRPEFNMRYLYEQ